MKYCFVGFLGIAIHCLPMGQTFLRQVDAQNIAPPKQQEYRALKLSSGLSDDALELKEHPLATVVRVAQQHLDYIHRSVRDYTCYLVKRERIDGVLLPTEHMQVKFRAPQNNETEYVPFSVFLRVLAPKSIQGREILYVRDRYGGDAIVRKGGRRTSFLTLRVDPRGTMAMRDNKYPITAFGFENLTKRLLDVAEQDMAYGECLVREIRGAKVDDRICTAYEVKHPVPRPYFRFHMARVFIDDELHVPIRYAAYQWPETAGGTPLLGEEYTYRQVKLNVGLTDLDFDTRNPEYDFSEQF
jgi:hypothetical protein